MAKFVSADGGVWVNLDHCATVEELHYTGKPTAWLFKNSDGNTIARLSNAREDFETAAATIWPSAPGATALIVETFCNATYGGRPDTVYSQCIPIAGWQLACGMACPVLPEAPTGCGVVLIATPDGKFLSPEDCTYGSQTEAEASILADAQAYWDSHHTKADGAKRDRT